VLLLQKRHYRKDTIITIIFSSSHHPPEKCVENAIDASSITTLNKVLLRFLNFVSSRTVLYILHSYSSIYIDSAANNLLDILTVWENQHDCESISKATTSLTLPRFLVPAPVMPTEPRPKVWVLDEQTRLTKMRVNDKLYCEGKVRPTWRGHLHKYICMVLPFVVVGMWGKSETATEIVSTISFSVGMLLTYGTSYMFHCIEWTPKSEIFIYKLDHFMIFMNAASVTTQYGLLLVRIPIIISAWVVCIVGGILIALKKKETVHNALSGVVLLFIVPDAMVYMSSYQHALFFGTWIQVLVGMVIFGLKKPDPWPNHFGYHGEYNDSSHITM
jgi:hemolysin III